MSFFLPQACSLFPPITSASLEYFLEGCRVSVSWRCLNHLISPSVFLEHHMTSIYPATLGNNVRSLCHTFLRQSGAKGQGKLDGSFFPQRPEGWKLCLSLWFPRVHTAELSSLTNRPCRSTLSLNVSRCAEHVSTEAWENIVVGHICIYSATWIKK